MTLEQAIITWIHFLAATIWVGGSLFIGVVLAPILKTMHFSSEERLQMMIQVGRRFNKIAIPSLVILIVTGLYQSNQILTNHILLFSTNYGFILLIKIILVISLIITYAIHVRIIRKDVEKKIISKNMSEGEIKKLRIKIIILGQITIFISIAVLFLASLLDTGF